MSIIISTIASGIKRTLIDLKETPLDTIVSQIEFVIWPCVCVCVLVTELCPTLQTHGLYLAGLLCPWNSPGKNTGVGCHSLLQEVEPGSPELQADSLQSE